MDYLKKLPAELEKLLGSDAWKFVDSLNQAFLALREEVISMSSAHSENRLSTEISRLRQEIAETRADMGELRTELKADMAALRDEVRADIQELRVRIGKLEDGMTISRMISVKYEWNLQSYGVNSPSCGPSSPPWNPGLWPA